MSDTKSSASDEEVLDVVIVGAGISGINAAQRIQTLLPWAKYTILESRSVLGGTWSFFKYPGFRSDSDLYTFGFSWRPWTEGNVIASGESICKYLQESAAEYGIDKKIQYGHKLVSADWSSKRNVWDLLVDADGQKTGLKTRFVILSTGYYDYDAPLETVIPGLKDFKGVAIHPQFWPEDLDYSDKKVVVIGSGATAVTMVPVLAEKAARVTMLQRSPSYIMSIPMDDPLARWAYRWLPKALAHQIIRAKFILISVLFVGFCTRFPNAARKLLRKETVKQLPKSIGHDPHFEPKYNPWAQRMCLCPDGDFFKALNKGKVDMVTGAIQTVTQTGIRVEGGETIEADIIITATGLKLQIAGGAVMSIDGQPVTASDKFLWKGIMIQDVPNVANVVGYTRASWTLGAEATAQHVCRMLAFMRRHGYAAAVPRVRDPHMQTLPILDMSSTYVTKGMKDMPKTGSAGPWKPRSQYLVDIWQARFGNLRDGMEYVRG